MAYTQKPDNLLFSFMPKHKDNRRTLIMNDDTFTWNLFNYFYFAFFFGGVFISLSISIQISGVHLGLDCFACYLTEDLVGFTTIHSPFFCMTRFLFFLRINDKTRIVTIEIAIKLYLNISNLSGTKMNKNNGTIWS